MTMVTPWSFMEITATQFKAKCLGIIDKVQKEECHVIISKHGKPAAKLVPISENNPGSIFGRSKGTVKILGDSMTTNESWDAEA